MKKSYLIMAAIASIALASCSDEQFVGDIDQGAGHGLKEISFASSSGKTTRGATDFTGSAAAAKLNGQFIVGGFKGTGTTASPATSPVFDDYQVQWGDNSNYTTTSNTSGWEYVGLPFLAPSALVNSDNVLQSIKYWDYNASQYDFIAYSLGNGYNNTKATATRINPATATTSTGTGDGPFGAYTLTGTKDQLKTVHIADLVTVYRNTTTENPQGDYNKVVTFTFRPLTAKVRIALYEIIPGYSVKNVVFYTDGNTAATDGKAYLYATGTDVFNESGTYTVYFPTIGSGNKTLANGDPNPDYNKAHVAFTAATSGGTAPNKDFGALSGDLSTNHTFASPEFKEAEITANDANNKGYLGRSSSSATYAGTYKDASNNILNYYTIVLPNEDGAMLKLKVDYTLVSTDGSGEVITVTGAEATVPKQYAQWKPGYAYTYLFKISDNTNGATNPDAGPAGLYPITFDAVVVNDEVNNTQETITTVSEPSITTYAKGSKVLTNNEYEADEKVYAVVEENNSLATLSADNMKLYTVTTSDATNFPITEASVAEAIAKYSTMTTEQQAAAKIKFTARSFNYGKTIVAEDGSTVTMDATNNVVADFNTAANTVYAIEYTNSSGKKFYKIVKVAAAQQTGGGSNP